MKNIDLFFYTDSIAFPRLAQQSSQDTFPFLISDFLENRLKIKCNLYIRSLGGGKISQIRRLLIRDTGYFSYHGDKICIAIFNIGIVDCSPQPFTYHLRILSKIPLLNKYLWPSLRTLLRKYRYNLQKIYSFRRTSPYLFSYYFTDMVKRANDSGMVVFSLGTPLTSDQVEYRSPGLRKSIDQYNTLKRKTDLCTHISLDWYDNSHFLDEHHFDNIGHRQVAEKIFSKVSETLDKSSEPRNE